jgi:hypothetical protein
MNLLRPFEPRLVISLMLSPEKAEEVFQTAEEEFKSGLEGCEGYWNWIGSPKTLGPKRRESRRLEIISPSR